MTRHLHRPVTPQRQGHRPCIFCFAHARLPCLNATRSSCFRDSAKRPNLGVYSYVSAKRESKKIDVISASLISAVPMKRYTTFGARTSNIGQREAGFTPQAVIIPTNVETHPTKATSRSVSACTDRGFEVLVKRDRASLSTDCSSERELAVAGTVFSELSDRKSPAKGPVFSASRDREYPISGTVYWELRDR